MLLLFIDLFLKGGKDVKATEANFFQSFFLLFLDFNVILISCLTTQGKAKGRLQTNKDKMHFIYFLVFVSEVY